MKLLLVSNHERILGLALLPVISQLLLASLQINAGHVRLPNSSSSTSEQVAEELASRATRLSPREDDYASREAWPPSKWFPRWHKCGMAPLNPIGGAERGWLGDIMAGDPISAANASRASRLVIGGEEQKYGAWPWYVRVLTRYSGDNWDHCGGVLISDRHVLTAAHCVWLGETLKKGTDFELYFADHSVSGKDEHEMKKSVKSVCPSKIFYHNNKEISRDWAVLELYTPVQFNDHIQHACLPLNRKELPPTGFDDPDTKCTVVGAGIMAIAPTTIPVPSTAPAGSWPSRIQGTTDPVADGWHQQSIDHEKLVRSDVVRTLDVGKVDCKSYYPSIPPDDTSHACYKSRESGKDACRGDSGGPVVCYREDGDQWYVMGTVSFGAHKCTGYRKWTHVYADIGRLAWEILRVCPNVISAITNKAANIK